MVLKVKEVVSCHLLKRGKEKRKIVMNEDKALTGYPSIDRPWLKYYSEDVINKKIPKCSIYQNIYDSNEKYLMHTALIFFGRKITYKALFRNIDKVAKALTAYGVKYGDNVAICMPATPEAVYIVLGLNKIGANANMLNPTFNEEQLIDRVKETKAELMMVVNELYTRIQSVVPKTDIKTVVACSAVNSLGAIVKCAKKFVKFQVQFHGASLLKRGKDK